MRSKKLIARLKPSLKNMVECKQKVAGEVLRLHSLAYQLTGDKERAKDLMQEVYIIAHKFVDNGGKVKNVKNWLRQVMINLNKDFSKNYLSEHRKLQSITDDLLTPDFIYNDGLTDCQREDLEECSSRLPCLQKKVFYAFRLGYSYEEISQQLSISNDSVRKLISLSRKRLTKQLELR